MIGEPPLIRHVSVAHSLQNDEVAAYAAINLGGFEFICRVKDQVAVVARAQVQVDRVAEAKAEAAKAEAADPKPHAKAGNRTARSRCPK